MEVEHWERVKELYEAALERDEPERSAFLDQACPNDSALRDQVESLLSGERKLGDFLKEPIVRLSPALSTNGTPPPAFSPGEIISGRFQVLRFIGRGGMGEVYEARDLERRARVALKTIRPEIASDPKTMARFNREIDLALRVTHRNVCRVYDLERHHPPEGSGKLETVFLTMELLEGETLADRLRRTGRMSYEEALPLIRQMADGLAAAHQVGVIHRDFKPGNVMLVPERASTGGQVQSGQTTTSLDTPEEQTSAASGLVRLAPRGPVRAVITDFGLAKASEAASIYDGLGSVTAARDLIGTPAYMAPEQLEGREMTPATDVYALGLVIYEMITAHQPFPGNPYNRLREPAASLRVHVPDLDQCWERVVFKCLEFEPTRRFGSVQEVSVELSASGEGFEEGSQLLNRWTDSPSTGRAKRMVARSFLGAVALILALILWYEYRAPRDLDFAPLTTDAGLTWDPTLSADGKTMAYASDRNRPGGLNIWVQDTGSGSAMQVTHDTADCSNPALSPDGSLVAYRSERDGGAIYVSSVYGGYQRLLARLGRHPRFSPDGKEILYWVGEEKNVDDQLGVPGKIFVVPTEGGAPKQMETSFADARYPIWSPDGTHIMFEGSQSRSGTYRESADWWVTSLDGRELVQTGAFRILRREGLTLYACPFYWKGDAVVFAARKVFGTNLWQLGVPRNFRPSGSPRRLTSGTDDDVSPWVSSTGRLVFITLIGSASLWSLPATGSDPSSNDALRRVTSTVGVDKLPSLSSDGTGLVFFRRRGEVRNVWYKDLQSGQETALSSTGNTIPVISQDGSRVAYSFQENDKHPIYVAPISGGPREAVCEDCGDLTDWSAERKQFLYSFGEPAAIGLLDAVSGRKTILAARSDARLGEARFSLDGNWVAFVAITGEDQAAIEVIHINGAGADSDWMPLNTGASVNLAPTWSPDGTAILMISNLDGFQCLWKADLDPATKHLLSPPHPLHHFHDGRLSPEQLTLAERGLSLGGRTIALNLAEVKGNIFSAQMRH